jgi:hypothetical protein
VSPRQRRQALVVVAGAVIALAVLLGQFWLMSRLSWTHREDPANSLIGFNFSCDQAEYLLLETPGGPFVPDDRPDRAEWCAGVLTRLLRETGSTAVRISLQWEEIEPVEGQFDFSLTDGLLRAAGAEGATVTLSVGMKAQRHPEFYIPQWALEGTSLNPGDVISDDPLLRARALAMAAAAVQHFAASDVVDSWSAENEPYIASHRSEHYRLGEDYVAELVATIRANDPERRPVSINHAQHFVMDRRWKQALKDSDVLAQSMYPRRNWDLFTIDGIVNIMELGPLMPNYAHQAREAHAANKEFWVTELQAEPWTDHDIRLFGTENPSPNLSPAWMAENVNYARKSGADRIYLWGAEWWLFQAERGDARWLSGARGAIAGGDD